MGRLFKGEDLAEGMYSIILSVVESYGLPNTFFPHFLPDFLMNISIICRYLSCAWWGECCLSAL